MIKCITLNACFVPGFTKLQNTVGWHEDIGYFLNLKADLPNSSFYVLISQLVKWILNYMSLGHFMILRKLLDLQNIHNGVHLYVVK